MASQSAFALVKKYNKKIGTNRRFKCIINSRIEPAMEYTDYEICRIPFILSSVYLRVYMSHLLRFSPYVKYACRYLTV
jgi:hypothetical protein